ncbi:PD40 domain-containing protein [Streptomyces sp. NA04227]|nr:PD40 domain-containing protein [Streptomyces sp. NA04227]
MTTTGYVLWRRTEVDAAHGAEALHLERAGTVVYVDRAGGGTVRQVTRSGKEVGKGPACQRAAAAGSTLICLHARPGPFSSQARIYTGASEKPKVTLPLWGEPSRARVSPSGRLVAWTVFRTGDSYAVPGQFSTTAGIYDVRDGRHFGSLEDFAARVDGKPYDKPDLNFWGVTFASDDRTFYATMASKSRTWLVRGDLTKRTLTALHENVECPSLSPDGRRIAYKKKTGGTWRLHVLDLRTMAETALAERADIDDQASWLGADTVAYAKSHDGAPAVFTVPADGSGAPRRLLDGSSPTLTNGQEQKGS